MKILDLRKNEHFGDSLMIDNLRSPLTLRTKTKSADLLLMSKLDVMRLSDEFTTIFEKIYEKSSFNLSRIIEKIKNIKEEKVKLINKMKLQQQFFNKQLARQPEAQAELFDENNYFNTISHNDCSSNNENNLNNAETSLNGYKQDKIRTERRDSMTNKIKMKNTNNIIDLDSYRIKIENQKDNNYDRNDNDRKFDETIVNLKFERTVLLESSNRLMLAKGKKTSSNFSHLNKIQDKAYSAHKSQCSENIRDLKISFWKNNDIMQSEISRNLFSPRHTPKHNNSPKNFKSYRKLNLEQSAGCLGNLTICNVANASNHLINNKELLIPNELIECESVKNINHIIIPEILPSALSIKNKISAIKSNQAKQESFIKSPESFLCNGESYSNSFLKYNNEKLTIKPAFGASGKDFKNTTNKFSVNSLDLFNCKELDSHRNNHPNMNMNNLINFEFVTDSNSSDSINLDLELINPIQPISKPIDKTKIGKHNRYIKHDFVQFDSEKGKNIALPNISNINHVASKGKEILKIKSEREVDEMTYLCAKCNNIITRKINKISKKLFEDNNCDYSIEKVNSICILGSTEESSVEEKEINLSSFKANQVFKRKKFNNFNINKNNININNIHINNNNNFPISFNNADSKKLLNINNIRPIKDLTNSKNNHAHNKNNKKNKNKNKNSNNNKANEILSKLDNSKYSSDNEEDLNNKTKLLINSILDCSVDIVPKASKRKTINVVIPKKMNKKNDLIIPASQKKRNSIKIQHSPFIYTIKHEIVDPPANQTNVRKFNNLKNDDVINKVFNGILHPKSFYSKEKNFSSQKFLDQLINIEMPEKPNNKPDFQQSPMQKPNDSNKKKKIVNSKNKRISNKFQINVLGCETLENSMMDKSGYNSDHEKSFDVTHAFKPLIHKGSSSPPNNQENEISNKNVNSKNNITKYNNKLKSTRNNDINKSPSNPNKINNTPKKNDNNNSNLKDGGNYLYKFFASDKTFNNNNNNSNYSNSKETERIERKKTKQNIQLLNFKKQNETLSLRPHGGNNVLNNILKNSFKIVNAKKKKKKFLLKNYKLIRSLIRY